MLVITRRTGQRLFIGDVRVVVLEVARGTVRLGIEAPRDVLVLRAELDGKPKPPGDAPGSDGPERQ